MKVIVTGATGFLGQNLVPKLNELYGKNNILPISTLNYNLLSEYECEHAIIAHKPDVIIHAAGTVGGIGANANNPGKFIYENLMMGMNIIHNAMKYNVGKFILLGTVCSYPKFTSVPFKEEDFWLGYPEETNAPYGIAKKTLVEMLVAYKKQYGLNSTVLIPSNMYGPYDHFNLTNSHVIPAIMLKFFNAMRNPDYHEDVTLWGTGQASREFLFVEDCVDAILLAMEKDTEVMPINIGNGREIKIVEAAETIANIMGYRGTMFFDASKPDGQPRRCLDINRAKSMLGFNAKTSFEDGLKKTIDWFKEYIK